MGSGWALVVVAALSLPFTRTTAKDGGSLPPPRPAYCAADGFYEGIPDWPQEQVIAQLEGVIIAAQLSG